MKNCIKTLLVASLALASAAWAADDWPRQPIRMVVPFTPGGGTDVLARMVGERMAARLGQPVIIDNRAGASGNIGTAFVAKSPADGYTILFHITMFPAYKLTFAKPGYDGFADFVAIGTVATSPSVLVVNEASPFKTLKDLVAAGKAGSHVVTYGSAGLGSPQHLAMAQMAQAHGFRAEHVPYKGTSAAVTDLLASQVDAVSAGLGSVHQLMEAHKLRAVAVLGPKRSALIPDIPSAGEAGFASIDSSVRFLLLAPAKTPQAVVDRLGKELSFALSDPALRAGFAKVGCEPLDTPPEQTAAMLRTEYDVLEPIIKGLDLQKQ